MPTHEGEKSHQHCPACGAEMKGNVCGVCGKPPAQCTCKK
jgi:hypothetical protein